MNAPREVITMNLVLIVHPPLCTSHDILGEDGIVYNRQRTIHTQFNLRYLDDYSSLTLSVSMA